ncbi:MAG: hypothetical protein AB7T06_22250 [Kofleriaceae bacterium]
MRSALLAIAVLAACGDGGSNTDAGGGDDQPPQDGMMQTVDGPPPGTPLVDRISVATVTAPAGVMAGDSNYRIWGRQNLRVAPVFTVPLESCGTLVGYTTGTAQAPMARVAKLDVNDQLVATYDLGAFVLRGLAAEPDGHFGALLWNSAATTKTIQLSRFDANGGNKRDSPITDTIWSPTDFGIGESRLEFGDGKYGAYFHVHGVSGNFNGHEGDSLKWIDAATGTVTNGWSWGCSHSMSDLLRYEPTSKKFLAACVTDCFPGTQGTDFANASIGGVYLDHARKVLDVNGGCNGSVAGELGGMTPGPSGWKLVFNAHQNAATLGQQSYNASTMNQDIGFSSIAANGTPGAVKWLTTTPGNEANAAIAAWSGDGAEEYVIGWAEVSGSSRTYKLGRFGPTGGLVYAPADVTSLVKWGERDDPFRTTPSGDIVWAWFDMAGATSFNVARIRGSGTCN